MDPKSGSRRSMSHLYNRNVTDILLVNPRLTAADTQDPKSFVNLSGVGSKQLN